MSNDAIKQPGKLRGFSIIERAVDRLGSDIGGNGGPSPGRVEFVPPPIRSAPATPIDHGPIEPGPIGQDRPAAVALPADRLRARGLIAPGDGRSKLTEQYRLIKRPLITRALAPAKATGPSAKLIMVTSAVPREGKTFTAFNLALSISSERDIEVVLIDADPHRGQLLETLGLEQRPGLLEYLAGEVRSLSSVLLPTERDNLWVLPPGSPHEHHSELLAGARMAALTDELDLARRPRIVLFDTPPLLASTESVMLASHVGQIVVVVEAAKTSRRILEQALVMVSACPEVNLLLNKADALRQYERYGEYQIAS